MKECLREEKLVELDYFNASCAWEIGEFLVNKAKKEKLAICIDIFANNRQMFHYSSDGCTADNDNWLRRKRNTVLHFQHCSKFMAIKLKDDSVLFENKYGVSLKDMCIVAGGVPIKIKDSGIIGAICVSGLLADDDHRLVIDTLLQFKKDKGMIIEELVVE